MVAHSPTSSPFIQTLSDGIASPIAGIFVPGRVRAFFRGRRLQYEADPQQSKDMHELPDTDLAWIPLNLSNASLAKSHFRPELGLG
jgi:hypothetical protein